MTEKIKDQIDDHLEVCFNCDISFQFLDLIYKKQKMIEIYSYCDSMIRDNEDWNVKTYDDPYAWLDPPEDIYASNLISSSSSSSTVISSADSQTVKSSSTEKKMTTAPVPKRSFVISTNPYHNRYLSRPQLHWWGLQTSPPLLTRRDHCSPAPPYSRLTQYHDDMIRKQKEEKSYHERLRNQQWLQSSLHVQQQQQQQVASGRTGTGTGGGRGHQSHSSSSHSQGKGVRYTQPPRGSDSGERKPSLDGTRSGLRSISLSTLIPFRIELQIFIKSHDLCLGISDPFFDLSLLCTNSNSLFCSSSYPRSAC
jgi:hypothetical protein